ncbi:MAG: hypothetical protein ACPGU7_04080 [Gammaproteobacteria bacterium]
MANVTPEARYVVNHMVDPITFFWRTSEPGSKNIPDEHRVVDMRGTLKAIIFKRIERDERESLSAEEVIELTHSVIAATKLNLASKKSCYLENHMTLDPEMIRELASQVEALNLTGNTVTAQTRDSKRDGDKPAPAAPLAADEQRRQYMMSAIEQMKRKFLGDDPPATTPDLEPRSNATAELDECDRQALTLFRPMYLKEFFDDYSEGGYEGLRDRLTQSDHMRFDDAESLAEHLSEGISSSVVRPTELAGGLIFVGASNPTNKIVRVVKGILNAQTIDGLRRMMVSMDQFKSAYQNGKTRADG